jgi:hypothetical protein
MNPVNSRILSVPDFFLNKLPDEVLIQIFQRCLENPRDFLNLSLVSRHFYRITRDPYFFPCFEIIARTGLKIVLDLSGHIISDQEVLIRFFKNNSAHLKRIESLDLFKHQIRSWRINLVCEYFSHIQELKWISSSTVKTKAIKKFEKFTSLKSLDLSDTKINNKCLKIITRHCPGLKQINLDHCRKLKDTGIEALVKGCPQLESINLSACNRLTNNSLHSIAKNCPNLKEIIFFDNHKVDNDGFMQIFSYCQKLQKIWCDQMTNAALMRAAQNCPNLKSLYLDGKRHVFVISTRTLKFVSNKCPEIIELQLPHSYTPDRNVISTIFRNLKVLNLRGWRELTEKEIKLIVDRCPELTTLDLSWNSHVTDDTIQYIGENLKYLSEIHLIHCSNTSHLFLDHLAKCSQHFKAMSFTGSVLGEYDGKSLAAFFQQHPNLQTFYLGYCDQLTDEMVKMMAPYLQKLRKLTLYYCEGITDEAIEILVRHCRLLEEVDLRMCSHITVESVATLTTRCPHLRVVHVSLQFMNLRKYLKYAFTGKIREESVKCKWHNNG